MIQVRAVLMEFVVNCKAARSSAYATRAIQARFVSSRSIIAIVRRAKTEPRVILRPEAAHALAQGATRDSFVKLDHCHAIARNFIYI